MPRKISRRIAVAVTLVVLAAAALIAANGNWHTPVSHSANGGWHTPVQPSTSHWGTPDRQPLNGKWN